MVRIWLIKKILKELMQYEENRDPTGKKAVAYLRAVSEAIGVPVLWKTVRAYNAYRIPSEMHDHCNPFCRGVKAHQSLVRRCAEIHRTELFRADRDEKAPALRRCHAGVYEIVVPVLSEGRSVGVLYAGPWRMEEEPCIPQAMEKEYLSLPQYDDTQGETARLLLELVAHWISASGIDSDQGHNPGQGDSRIEKVKTLLSRSPGRLKSAEEAAATVCLSRFRFLHLFKESEGVSYGAYCKALRIDFAKNLLLGTRLSITEISSMCGYGDPNNFSSGFHAHVGVSPTVFRRSQGDAPR